MEITLDRGKLYIKKTEEDNIYTLVILSVVLFLNYCMPNDFVSIIITMALSCYILVCKKQLCVATMLYFVHFAYLFRFEKYEIYAFLAVAFIARSMFEGIRKFQYVIGVALIYLFLHIISSQWWRFSFADVIPFLVILNLMAGCLLYNPKEKEKCLRNYILGHIVATILAFFKSATRLRDIMVRTYVSNQTWNDTERFSGLSYDPNFYTVEVILTLAILLFSYTMFKHSTWTIAVTFSIATGMLTLSKSYFASCVILLGVFLFSKNGAKKKTLLKMLPFLLLLLLAFHQLLLEALVVFFKRFDELHTMDQLLTGRQSLWHMYWNATFKNPESLLFGHGLLDRLPAAAHNTYLEILYKFGVVGFVSDVIYVFLCYQNMKVKRLKRFSNIVITALFLALIFNLSAYSYYGFWSSIMVIFIMFEDKITVLNETDNHYMRAKI